MTGLSAGDYVLDLELHEKTGEKLGGMYTTASQNFLFNNIVKEV